MCFRALYFFLCSWAVGNSNWDSVKFAYHFGIISGNAGGSSMYWDERGKGKDGKLRFLLMVLGDLYMSRYMLVMIAEIERR